MEILSRLRAEAQATNERRLIVLSGSPEATRTLAASLLASTAIDPGETTYVGPADSFQCESLAHSELSRLLGTTREAIIYDCWERCEPNALGALVGAVDGGGLCFLLTPPFDQWQHRLDAFDESLAVEPFDRAAVTTAFRRRLIETLEAHRGITVIDADRRETISDGRCGVTAGLDERTLSVPATPTFPQSAYEACKTQDQIDTLSSFESLHTDDTAVVVEADRGRGKSSAAGLAAASLALAGQDILVTAPTRASVQSFFDRARELLTTLPQITLETESPGRLETDAGRIRFEQPATAATLPEEPDTVFVDEAAAIPARLLEAFLAARAVAFTTTVRGYEGTGRGFAVRFRERLSGSRHSVTERSMTEPIRYAAGDPIEVWLFRALALDARPPVEELVTAATPDTVSYQQVSSAEILADEQLLRELFGLLVLAHYRTEPNDLARLLDAPNVTVHALTIDGHIVSVALCALEGNLSAQTRSDLYEGSRINGNLIPDILSSQLRDEAAGAATGLRVMRIATHASVRSRGLGSQLLTRLESHARERELDWLGVSFGVTPGLAEFWQRNGYRSVHLSTTRNDRSGEHSAVMLSPLTPRGEALLDRHTDWFLRRTPAAIRESLSACNPDVIRVVCESAAGVPALSLSPAEWRHVAGLPHGASVYQTAPRGVRALFFRHLVAPDEELLTSKQQQLLIRTLLQGQPWERIRDTMAYQSNAQCMRALGAAVEPLVACYGDQIAQQERERYSS